MVALAVLTVLLDWRGRGEPSFLLTTGSALVDEQLLSRLNHTDDSRSQPHEPHKEEG
jgi:hypothetical protein